MQILINTDNKLIKEKVTTLNDTKLINETKFKYKVAQQYQNFRVFFRSTVNDFSASF